MTKDNQNTQSVIYIRTATESQSQPSASKKEQEGRCLQAARKLGCDVGPSFTDAGTSGNSETRPGLEAMIEHISANRSDTPVTVLAQDINRISRNPVKFSAIRQRIENAGGALVIPEQH